MLADIAGTAMSRDGATYLTALRRCFIHQAAAIAQHHLYAASAAFNADITQRARTLLNQLEMAQYTRAHDPEHVQTRQGEIQHQLTELRAIEHDLDRIIDQALTLETFN